MGNQYSGACGGLSSGGRVVVERSSSRWQKSTISPQKPNIRIYVTGQLKTCTNFQAKIKRIHVYTYRTIF